MLLEIKDKNSFVHVLPVDAVEVLVSVNAVLFRRKGFQDIQCIYKTAEAANVAVQSMLTAHEAEQKIFRYISE